MNLQFPIVATLYDMYSSFRVLVVYVMQDLTP